MTTKKKHICSKCGKNVNKNQYSIKCTGQCASFFHEGYCGLLKKQFAEHSKQKNHHWKCNRCKTLKSDVTDQSSGSDSDITSDDEREERKKTHLPGSTEEVIYKTPTSHKRKSKPKETELGQLSQKLNPSNSDIMKYLKSKFSEFEDSLNYYGNSLDELKKSMEKLSEENRQLRKDKVIMEQRIQKLETEVERFNTKKSQEEAEDRKKNLIVNGLPVNKEKCTESLHKLFRALEVSVSPQDISKTKILETNNDAPVLVSFNREESKIKIIEARKKKGLFTLKCCNLGDSNKKKIINEDLPKEVRELFSQARQLRSKGYKFVWCKYEKVFARKEDDSVIIHIKNSSQIQSLGVDPSV